MAFYTEWVERLQAVRLRLADNVMINDPENYSKLTGTIDFLLNTNLNPRTIDVVQQRNAASSQYRSVEIRYQPHWGNEDLVIDDSGFTCDRNNQRRDLINTYDVNLFTSYKFTLDEDYLRSNTEDWDSKDQRMARSMRSAMRVCRENMSEQLLAKMAALSGTNPAKDLPAGSFQSVNMISSDSGADVKNFDVFKNDQEDNFMTGDIAIIGQAGNARRYFNRLAVGNLNTNAGIDIRDVRAQFGALYFQDQSAAATLGDTDNVLAVYPGLTQFYGYNTNEGDFMHETPDQLIKGTMADPIYPILWDFDLAYDRNCVNSNGIQGAWVVRIWKYFDLFTVPVEAFGGEYSDLAGFNGILGYNLTSAD